MTDRPLKDEPGFGTYLRENGWKLSRSDESDSYSSYGALSALYEKNGKNIVLGLMSIGSTTFIGIVNCHWINPEAKRPYKYAHVPDAENYKHYENVYLLTEEPIYD